MQVHTLKKEHKNLKKKIVGRGGKRGKTSGRGHKGQKQHGGHGIRPQMRDTIKKIPKKRGYRFNSIQIKPTVINIKDIEAVFENDALVSPQTLVEKLLIERKKGKIPKVKILSVGDLSKKITILNCILSKAAQEKIEKAGGKISE